MSASGAYEALPEGTLARVTTFVEGFEARVGETFEVEDYVSAEESEDGVAFYWGSNSGGVNNVTAAASSVEVVQTAQQMRDRQVPTCEEVAEAVQGELMSLYGLLNVDEGERDGATVILYGETPDGLRVAVDVRVLGVTRVDL